MINLTVEEIIALQARLIARTGGIAGLRELGLLESAVYSAMQCFGDVEVYATPCERAARLAYAITLDHAFLDGNKRIGILAMLMTLRLNRVDIKYTQDELVALGLGIADGSLGYEDILAWIIEHKPGA